MKWCIVVIAVLAQPLWGKTNLTTYSLQVQALAPNAGGQQAYSIRQGTDDKEIGVFVNTYLLTGDYPLMGAIYDWRFPICDQACFLQMYTQLGLGISTAGPIISLSWSMITLWTIRIDVASHLMIAPDRIILWSYPFWVGFSVPI